MGKLSIASELWSYLKIRKKWWLLPILLFLLIIGTLLDSGGRIGCGPFDLHTVLGRKL